MGMFYVLNDQGNPVEADQETWALVAWREGKVDLMPTEVR